MNIYILHIVYLIWVNNRWLNTFNIKSLLSIKKVVVKKKQINKQQKYTSSWHLWWQTPTECTDTHSTYGTHMQDHHLAAPGLQQLVQPQIQQKQPSTNLHITTAVSFPPLRQQSLLWMVLKFHLLLLDVTFQAAVHKHDVTGQESSKVQGTNGSSVIPLFHCSPFANLS